MARLSYSMVVRGLTVALPLVALGLLSTLFLLARTAPEDSALPFQTQLRDRQDTFGDAMRAPFFTGVTEAGDSVAIRADLVRPETATSGAAEAESLQADIGYLDGSSLRILASEGHFAVADGLLHLAGDVVLHSSTGYDLYTEALQASLETGEARSDVPVRAIGPAGTIHAGGLVLERPEDAGLQLVFTNRVKLVYLPPQSSE